MTYLRNGWEYLTEDEAAVRGAILELAARKRTGNNSQIASATGLSRTLVGKITTELRMRGFITNTGKGAAYHWRVTAQPVPYSTEARHAAIALRRRQRELNEQIRTERTSS
jgi:DNA-binding IclR family transcriptional regulator